MLKWLTSFRKQPTPSPSQPLPLPAGTLGSSAPAPLTLLPPPGTRELMAAGEYAAAADRLTLICATAPSDVARRLLMQCLRALGRSAEAQAILPTIRQFTLLDYWYAGNLALDAAEWRSAL